MFLFFGFMTLIVVSAEQSHSFPSSITLLEAQMVSRRKRARLRYLRKWYQRYTHMAARDDSAHGVLPRFCYDDSVLLEADCDELQHCLVEARILENEATIRVQGRFCSDCQQRLDNWPALDVQSKNHPHVVRRYDTYYLEAAARSGCELCACVLQTLLDSKALALYRKIEFRLETLKSDMISCLTIGGWGHVTIRTLKMTLPGLKYPRTCMNDLCIDIRGHALDSENDSGELAKPSYFVCAMLTIDSHDSFKEECARHRIRMDRSL